MTALVVAACVSIILIVAGPLWRGRRARRLAGDHQDALEVLGRLAAQGQGGTGRSPGNRRAPMDEIESVRPISADPAQPGAPGDGAGGPVGPPSGLPPEAGRHWAAPPPPPPRALRGQGPRTQTPRSPSRVGAGQGEPPAAPPPPGRTPRGQTAPLFFDDLGGGELGRPGGPGTGGPVETDQAIVQLPFDELHPRDELPPEWPLVSKSERSPRRSRPGPLSIARMARPGSLGLIAGLAAAGIAVGLLATTSSPRAHSVSDVSAGRAASPATTVPRPASNRTSTAAPASPPGAPSGSQELTAPFSGQGLTSPSPGATTPPAPVPASNPSPTSLPATTAPAPAASVPAATAPGARGSAPTITRISPASGTAGQTVTLTGANFYSPGSGAISVSFGGVPAGVACPTQTSCAVTVPARSASATSPAVHVTVSTDFGTSRPVVFRYG